MSDKIEVVYVAGAYSGNTIEEVEANVEKAIACANRLMDAGLYVKVPHLSHYLEARKRRHYEWWMEMDQEADLLRSDAVLRMPGPSKGADREVKVADEHGIPIFLDEAFLIRTHGNPERAMRATREAA